MTQVKPIQLLLLVLIISSATLNAQVPQNAEDISPLLIGEKLPEAMLLDEDGKPINLNEDIAKNKNVLLRYNIESKQGTQHHSVSKTQKTNTTFLEYYWFYILKTDRLRGIKLNYSPIVISLKGVRETASLNY
jgi:hypothetical protein